MHPDLVAAISNRRDIGRTAEEVMNELVANGYPLTQAQEAVAAVYGQIDANVIAQATSEAPVHIPSFRALVAGAAAFMQRHPKLFGLLAVSMVIVPTLDTLVLFLPHLDSIISFVSIVVGVVGFFMLIIGFWAAIYISARPESATVTINESRGWLGGNLFMIFLTSLVGWLVAFAATIPFIIPGIIMYVYMLFVAPVMAREHVYGLSALRRSQQLVAGHWWPIAGRVFALTGALFFVGLLLGFLQELMQSIVPFSIVLFTVITGALSVIAALMSAYFSGTLMQVMLTYPKATMTTPSSNLLYIMLLLWSPVALFLLATFMSFIALALVAALFSGSI